MRVLYDSDFEYTELQSPVAKVLWGIWLIHPTWQTFAGVRAYDTMAAVAPESTWGATFLFVGVAHLLAIASGHYLARLWMARVGVAIWVAVAGMFGMTSVASTGVPIYMLIGLGAAWSSWRLGARRKSGDG